MKKITREFTNGRMPFVGASLFVRVGIRLFVMVLLTGVPVSAQTSNGTIGGLVNERGNPLEGVTVIARGTSTGWHKIDITSETGHFQFTGVPDGVYDVSAWRSGYVTQVKTGIRVDARSAIAVNFDLLLSGANSVHPGIETTLINQQGSGASGAQASDRHFQSFAAETPFVLSSNPSWLDHLPWNGFSGLRNAHLVIDSGNNPIIELDRAFSQKVAALTLLTNRYKAEFKNATDGVFNVVPKTGTNDVHGTLFSLFRNQRWNGLTEAEKEAGQEDPGPYSREHFAGALGGPFVEDRVFFFFAAEQSQLDQQSIVETHGIAPELNGAIPVPTDDTSYSGNVTANLDPQQFLQVRSIFQKLTTILGASSNYAPDARASFDNNMYSLLASHNWILNEDQLNAFSFAYTRSDTATRPTSRNAGQVFPNGVYLGQNANAPQTIFQKSYQFRDDFSWGWRGNHQMKAGLSWRHEPVRETRFAAGTVPRFFHLNNDPDSPVVTIEFFGTELNESTPGDQFGFYFQDDWSVNENLTLNLGLRYDLAQIVDINQTQNSLYQVLHRKLENFPWLHPFQESLDGSIAMDRNNFQPRIGIAYDWKGDGTTVIRGGWGLYYDFPGPNENVLFPLAALSGYGAVYSHRDPSGIRNPDGSFFQVGDPLPPNQLEAEEAAIPHDVLSPDWVVPRTSQFSAGFSHQWNNHHAIEVDYVHVAFRDQSVAFRFNGLWNGQQYAPDHPATARIYGPFGKSDYDGISFTYRVQVHERLQMQTSYTLSKVTGNTLPGANQFDLGSPPTCENCVFDWTVGPADPRMFGPLNTDARHRVLLSGILHLPANFTVSGLLRANSAKPFNAFVSSDLNGDGHVYDTTGTPVNARRGEPFSQLDMRFAKFFEFGERVRLEGVLEIFNLFNATNPGANNHSGSAYNGVITDPDFGKVHFFAGDPGQGEQRVAQIGVRITF